MAFDGKAFVRRFGEVWNAHNLDGIIEMFTDDVVFEASFGEAPWGTRAVGKAAARKLIADMIERVPDIRWDEIRHFVCPDHATVESVTTGSPRDGKRFEVHLVDVLTLRDGKIAAKRVLSQGAALSAARRFLGRPVRRFGRGVVVSRGIRTPARRVCSACSGRSPPAILRII